MKPWTGDGIVVVYFTMQDNFVSQTCIKVRNPRICILQPAPLTVEMPIGFGRVHHWQFSLDSCFHTLPQIQRGRILWSSWSASNNHHHHHHHRHSHSHRHRQRQRYRYHHRYHHRYRPHHLCSRIDSIYSCTVYICSVCSMTHVVYIYIYTC